MNAGRMFEFNILMPEGSEIDLRIARFIKLNLNEVGIRVRLKAMPSDELNRLYYQNSAFEAILIELPAQIRRPEELLGMWTQIYASKAQKYGFASPEVARLADLILDTNDPETKKTLLQRFDRLIADLQPGSFLFQKIYIDAMSKRFVLNYPFSFDNPGYYRLQFARLKNE